MAPHTRHLYCHNNQGIKGDQLSSDSVDALIVAVATCALLNVVCLSCFIPKDEKSKKKGKNGEGKQKLKAKNGNGTELHVSHMCEHVGTYMYYYIMYFL